jgi:SAM-dependent methyltransferase
MAEVTASIAAPPEHLCRIIGCERRDDFLASGKHMFDIVRKHGNLRRIDRVLDVGCGCGRLAVPMTEFLTTGSYDGFDVVPELIDWASGAIGSRHPNFRFRRVDLRNDFYHPQGAGDAAAFSFPYDTGAFNMVCFFSVFTHLLYKDTRRYLAELARVLKPRGTGVLSFFILNEDSNRLRRSPGTTLYFHNRLWRGLRVEHRGSPESAVAYPEALLRSLLRENGLVLQELLFGTWCGRSPAYSYQDFVIVRKPG